MIAATVMDRPRLVQSLMLLADVRNHEWIAQARLMAVAEGKVGVSGD